MGGGVEELTLTIGASHLLMKGHKFLFPEIRGMTTLARRNFPQAPEGIEILIRMPDLGKKTSSGD